MIPADDLALDDTIPPDLIAEALSIPPGAVAAYVVPDAQQDDLEGLGAGAAAPATPAEAIANGLRLSTTSTYVGVGYCLKTVRGPEFEVGALYPDAETAWEETTGKHYTDDPAAIPRGAIPYWINGRHGHVALSVGGGMCLTTDYRRPGYVDLAPIAALAAWCGGELVGWAEVLNGVDVWPDVAKPHKPAHQFTLVERLDYVQRALDRARQNRAPVWRIRGLRAWRNQLRARLADKDPK